MCQEGDGGKFVGLMWNRKACIIMEAGLQKFVRFAMFEGIASATFILNGGYKVLTKDEVIQVLKESM